MGTRGGTVAVSQRANGRDARPPRRAWRRAVPVVLAAAGFLFAVSAHAAGGGDLRSGRVQDLPGLVASEQHRVTVLEARAGELRTQIAALTRSATVPQQPAEVATWAAAYGATAVHGPALTVTLDDAPHAPGQALPPGATPDDLVVHQQDVQAVVNALWQGGAEAMTIMDQRVTATAGVRCVGSTLLLEGHVYAPPYRISAIGDPDALQAALDADPGVMVYREYVAAYRLGYAVARHADLAMPAAPMPAPLQAAERVSS